MNVFAILLSLACFLLFCWIFTKHLRFMSMVFFGLLGSLFIVFLAHPPLWAAAFSGYPKDSFYDLNLFGRAGVITISALMTFLFFYALAIKSRWLLRKTRGSYSSHIAFAVTDCFIGLLLFGFLFSLTPQVYYTFYHLLIPSLPNQIVIKSLFHWELLRQIAELRPDDRLAHHLAGVIFYAIIPFTLLLHRAKLFQK